MGYYFVMQPCYGCGVAFTFNPNKVPSVKDQNGVKQPLCLDCVKRMQQRQRNAGVEVWPDPLPGAYDAAPEEEI